jgi:hypothetical protein
LKFETDIKTKIESLGINIAQIEKDYQAVGGCGFFAQLFTWGGCGRAKDKQRREIREL